MNYIKAQVHISGYNVYVIKDACRPVAANTDEQAIEHMTELGKYTLNIIFGQWIPAGLFCFVKHFFLGTGQPRTILSVSPAYSGTVSDVFPKCMIS